MVGIALSGTYIPAFRLDRGIVAQNWGRASIGGERSVANNDEDSATMAVEASINCLTGMDPGLVDGLFFASTTGVYQEKMNAVLVAAATDMRRSITTADFTQSLRAGTGAVKSALDAVKAGSMKNVLVAAADARLGYPRSDQEQAFGDGAAAVLVSGDDVVAEYEGGYSICNEMFDVWRNPEDTYVRTWESRFILGEGYTANMVEAVSGLLKKMNLQAKDITRVIMPAPDARTHKGLAKKLGFDAETQLADPLLSKIGHCGAAQPLIMLAAALEQAQPGDRLLLACYGDGADAMLFKVTEAIKQERKNRTLEQYLAHKLPLTSYSRFLSYKGLVETVPGEPFRLFSSATVTWRDRNSILRCHASKCNQCGTVAFPVQRVCPICDAKDDFVEVRIAEMNGQVFTYTLDNLAGRSDDPVVVQTVAEFGAEKVRFYGMMTDCIPAQVKVGMPLGLTFRRIYDGMGMHNYFWKCRPLTIGGQE
ncbi:MAG: 3-hydroxy-3-methylglutaryl CoA synthase [Proteobacteria bacterium]|nr:3-hydroxy-3-methylglutaryl CoA synthase [Pseudomonadota bacterium]